MIINMASLVVDELMTRVSAYVVVDLHQILKL